MFYHRIVLSSIEIKVIKMALMALEASLDRDDKEDFLTDEFLEWIEDVEINAHMYNLITEFKEGY